MGRRWFTLRWLLAFVCLLTNEMAYRRNVNVGGSVYRTFSHRRFSENVNVQTNPIAYEKKREKGKFTYNRPSRYLDLPNYRRFAALDALFCGVSCLFACFFVLLFFLDKTVVANSAWRRRR